MSEDLELGSVNRRSSASGNVEFSDAIVLHETSRSRVVLVPFFIPHSNHTELSVKIITYKKGIPDWIIREEKSITLNEPASRKLLKALEQNLSVSETNENGRFLLLRVSDGTADLGDHDPALVASALTKVLGHEDIVKHLSGTELSDELIESLRGAIRVKEMQSAVATLREKLNTGIVKEQVYQEWCEQHSWAFGSAYVVNDNVRNITASDSLDMLLPNVIAGYRDIVELKRPDKSVLNYDKTHRNYFWSADVSSAIGQCHRYLDVLHEVAVNGLRDHPEIVAYHPRAIIVIGRSINWDIDKLKALHGLNHRLLNVTVMTYDQLLAQGERLLEIVSPKLKADDINSSPDIKWDDIDF